MITTRVVPAPLPRPRVVAAQHPLTATLPTPWAYGWSFTDPMRKLAYNLTVTALSAVVALVVGTIVLAGLLRDQLDASTETLTFLDDIDLRGAGIAAVVLFGAIWSVAVLMRRSRRSRAHR
nr:hypothetical protein [Pseudonocardia autotrophica]